MTGSDYFERLYDDSDDPWGFTTSGYEQRKYDLTVASLPSPRYARAFEPGCSVGVLTARLAARCEELVAWDRVPAAVEQARGRVAGDPVAADRVAVGLGAVPDRWPSGTFDLVVVSELLYFLDTPARLRTHARILETLRPGGHLAACHWVHPFAEAPTNGRVVHAELSALPGLTRRVEHVEPDFVLDVLERTA